MARVIPAKTRYGYGGMIEGNDYLAVVKVLDEVAEVAGVKEDESIVIDDLVARVSSAFDVEREISFSLGYERGYTSGFEDRSADLLIQAEREQSSYDVGYLAGKNEAVTATVTDEVQAAREEGYREGFEAARLAAAQLPSEEDPRPDLEPTPRRRAKS